MRKTNDVFERLKEGLKNRGKTMVDVSYSLGCNPRKEKKISCIWHQPDNHPSLVLKDKYCECKSPICGKSGSAIDFVMQYRNITAIEAARELDTMFNLNIFESSDAEPEDAKPERAPEATYQYYDKDGKLFATKYRYRDADGEKSFQWQMPDGTWKQPPKPPLYNSYSVRKSKEVIFVEGEKDVDTLTRLKLPAVSVPNGAGSSWLKSYTEYFKGRDVVIIPDNDEAGKTLAQTCIDNIFGKAKSIRVVELRDIWQDIPEKADVTDYIENGGTVTELIELVRRTPERKTRFDYSQFKDISAADLQRTALTPVQFLVKDILPEGTSLIAAPSKIGKSWFVLDMGLSIAMGKPFLSRETMKCNVLYLALEDSLNRIKERMNKILAGDDAPENFKVWIDARRLDDNLLDYLSDYVKANDTKLIIIDTLQKIRGAAKKNEGAYDRDYREMGMLKKFADTNHVSLFFVHHTRKMRDDSDSFNMISGTNGIMGAADTAYTLIKDKRDSQNATLSITGRDVNQISDVIHFDKTISKWVRDGDLTEINRCKHKAEYHADPVVQTIIALVQERGGWKGQMGELLLEGERITGGDIADSPRQLGSHVRSLSNSLAFYNNISVDIAKNGNAGKIYSFRKVINGVDLTPTNINGTVELLDVSEY